MSMEDDETPEDRLRDMATAMELQDEALIPPGYKTEDAAQFIADIYHVLAKVQAS
jgi:hypothetical protein